MEISTAHGFIEWATGLSCLIWLRYLKPLRENSDFSERHVRYVSSPSLSFLYAVSRSVCRLSVTFVRPTQLVEIFGNVSTPFGTLAIFDIH